MIKMMFTSIRRKYFPTTHEREVRKWWNDGGDQRRYEYDLNCDSIVFDIGGYKGQWASDIYGRYSCYIYIFEPVKQYAQFISDRFRFNGKITVFNNGLGASNRVEDIQLADDASSIHKQWTGNKANNSEKIIIKDIYECMSNILCGRDISLLKINAEGAEYEILERLIQTQAICDIVNIQVQFHEICKESTKKMMNIQAELRKTHYATYSYKYVWENWARK